MHVRDLARYCSHQCQTRAVFEYKCHQVVFANHLFSYLRYGAKDACYASTTYLASDGQVAAQSKTTVQVT